jgi:IS5 family transposase
VLDKVRCDATDAIEAQLWVREVEHYRALLLKVIDQTQRRVFNEEKVPVTDKIVSLFEPHTDIIVKGARDVRYGHKVNLATRGDGFITYLNIEDGNPADKILYLPVRDACHDDDEKRSVSVVADGGYASQSNLTLARESGVKRAVFNKRVGLSYHPMGVKKTFKVLKNLRAGIEGNLCELKRAFGMGKANWKGHEGFKACVCSAVLSDNLMRMVRFSSASRDSPCKDATVAARFRRTAGCTRLHIRQNVVFRVPGYTLSRRRAWLRNRLAHRWADRSKIQ